MLRFKDKNKNKTIDSLRKFPGENAYEITYYGEYAMDEYLKCGAADFTAMAEFEAKHLLEGNDLGFFYQKKHNCSGFTAHNTDGDFLLCHDLDTQPKMPAVMLAENKVTGKTIGLSNLQTYSYFKACQDKYPDLDGDEWVKETACLNTENPFDCARVLTTPFEMQDGMNAHGLALVTFSAGGSEIAPYGNKIPLCRNSFDRAIVDRCRTVDEVIEFLDRYIYAPPEFQSHFQIADASGRSIIVEYVEGKMVIIPNDKPYQICSNFLIYNNPELEGFGKDRYLAYQEYLDAHDGIVDEETAFRLLHENHIPGDENYSVVFNLTKRTAAIQFAPEFAVTHRYQL